MTTISFFVPGTPVQQGSKRHVGNGIMVEAAPNLMPWRDSVIYAARSAMSEFGGAGGFPLDCPVQCRVTFRTPMPKSLPKAERDRVWRPKTTAPDLDKLTRAIGDALEQSGMIRSDARIWSWDVSKVQTQAVPGANVIVSWGDEAARQGRVGP